MLSRSEMLEILCNTMEIDINSVNEETVLEDLGESWDSLNRLSVISVVDTYANRSVPSNAIVKSKTIKDLIDLVCADAAAHSSN